MSEIRPRPALLASLYEQYLDSRDTVGFVYLVSKRYAPGALERLAVHPDGRTRCAAVLALGSRGDFRVNPTLGRALRDDDWAVRQLADPACRSVWNRVGSRDQRRRLIETVRLNAHGEYRVAVKKASSLLDELPDFAEAWYHRGAAWFGLDDFARAIQDFRRALEHNPYHFVAAAAIGDAYLRREKPARALRAFRHALCVNPELDRVREQAAELSRQVEGE